MKRYYALFVIMILSFTLCVGCSYVVEKPETSEPEQTLPRYDPIEFYFPTYYPWWKDDVFDYDMKHQPSDSEVLSITEGMSFYEVVDMLGYPHGVPNNPSIKITYCFKWITTEGNHYGIMFSIDPKIDFETLKTMTLDETYESLVVSHIWLDQKSDSVTEN